MAELTQWEPRHPNVAKLAALLRQAREFGNEARVPEGVPLLGGAGLGELLLGSAPEGIERIGYDEPLTRGSGQTLQARPEVVDAAMLAGSAGGRAVQAAPKLARGLRAAADEALQPVPRALSQLGGVNVGPQRMLSQAIPEGAERSQYLKKPTVADPQRVAFPDIYLRPDELVARAKVAPEDPLMQRLFGVTRDDLYGISQSGTRAGNITDRPFKAAAKGRGSEAAESVMTKPNEQRLLDIMSEAQKRPELAQGMLSWYTMDPLFRQFERLYGPERAVAEYQRFNTVTGMASPGSEVMTELNRGTAANWLERQGRFADFIRHGGGALNNPKAPADMRAIPGHPYHSTSQAAPMEKYFQQGAIDMGSAKVPSYIAASGVPETGFQTAWPVGDAHWSRLVGLPDVRGTATRKGVEVVPGASASVPEMVTLGPWFKDLAGKAGLEAVPGQALIWGAGSHATGVTSPIGAPKLELLAAQIGKTAQRLGISPEEARDLVIMGRAHAGKADPALLGAAGGGAAGAAALISALRDDQR